MCPNELVHNIKGDESINYCSLQCDVVCVRLVLSQCRTSLQHHNQIISPLPAPQGLPTLSISLILELAVNISILIREINVLEKKGLFMLQ